MIDDEPDKLDFQSHGLDCALRRGPMKHWCGYVAIPKGHPLHGLDYSDTHPVLDTLWVKRAREPLGNGGIIPLLCAAARGGTPGMDAVLAVHGGVTYATDHCPREAPDDRWWIGFDCIHAGDASPSDDRFGGIYRTIHYARGECEALAGQLETLGQQTRQQP